MAEPRRPSASQRLHAGTPDADLLADCLAAIDNLLEIEAMRLRREQFGQNFLSRDDEVIAWFNAASRMLML